MATNFRNGTMDAEPAVKAKGTNKHLALQNARAAGNWLRVKGALDKQKQELYSKLDGDKGKLLKQRERLQFTSLGLATVLEKKDDEIPSGLAPKTQTPRRMTFSDVYDALMMTVKEQNRQQLYGDAKSSKSEPGMRRGSTLSYDQKKVTRKPMNFSLQSLQRANTSFRKYAESITQDLDGEADTQEVDEVKPGVFDLNEEEKSLGPTLKLAPTSLPPIRNQAVFKPQSRNFARRSASNPEPVDIENVRYCRYLRNTSRGGRRNSAPAIRPMQRGMRIASQNPPGNDMSKEH